MNFGADGAIRALEERRGHNTRQVERLMDLCKALAQRITETTNGQEIDDMRGEIAGVVLPFGAAPAARTPPPCAARARPPCRAAVCGGPVTDPIEGGYSDATHDDGGSEGGGQ